MYNTNNNNTNNNNSNNNNTNNNNTNNNNTNKLISLYAKKLNLKALYRVMKK